ncbi:hypothetical protein BT93_L1178 [Corymbia citriodora subsp. variegata]|uniref:Bet v I/Major latex protein domain-containing protein n=1 Tax=Corymbia citriodora subsp. variegata TaxID=360336 RepID=A0A8T0CNF8_CORYI|nr:hypothetical protein BT93_L1178 [Corymbia citriodora subsp. variegata]
MTQTEHLKSAAKDLFKIYCSQPYRFPDLMPHDIQSIELLKGEWDQKDSERLWTFVDDGCGTWKDKVGNIHNNGMSITWILLEGKEPQKLYSSLKVVHQFSVSGNGCDAKVTLHYTKKDANNPDPEEYMNFLTKMLKAADKGATA